MQQPRRPEAPPTASKPELSEWHRQFRSLLDKVPAGVLIRRRQTVIYANLAFAESLGYAHPSEIIGSSVLNLFPQDERDRAVLRYRVAEREGAPGEPTQVRFLRKDGKTVLFEGSSVMLPDFEGGPALARVIRDVSTPERMEARLVFADRMASVGTLAAGVAHEINNPLAYVTVNMGFAISELSELHNDLARLERFIEDGSPALAIVDKMLPRLRSIADAVCESREGADRIRLIVRDLRTFSRADEDAVGPVDVRTVIESAANLAYNEIRHRAKLTKDFGEVPLVEGNEARLAQVVLNLLVNAAQAIPNDKSGRHEIKIVTGTDDEGWAVIEVSDTGAGIAPHVLGRIFDPFFTTKPIGVGTGLGLSICHGIVSAMGGQIAVESELGRGAVFRIILPAARNTESSSKMRAISEPPPRPGRILVVDDEPAIRSALGRVLGKDHELLAAPNAEEALRLLAADQAFDLILCALMMPVTSGIELYQELLRHSPALAERVVFLTGSVVSPQAAEFLASVGNPSIEKPFDPHDLKDLVSARLTQG